MGKSLLQRAVEEVGPEELLKALTPAQRAQLLYSYRMRARPEQLPPTPYAWDTWLAMAGRGWGKTWTGAQWVRDCVRKGSARHIGLIGRTFTDVRKTMVEGPSGILAVHPPWERPVWEPGNKRIVWPNGAVATCFSADKPDSLRGPQHQIIWGDEPAAWRYVQDAWDNAMFGLRIRRKGGLPPQVLATTTPRPIPWLKAIIAQAGTVTTGGATYDNAANLSPRFIREVLARYEGTRLGRQEIEAALLDEIEGALWTHAMIEATRLGPGAVLPAFQRIVVGVDPAVTAKQGSSETGIVVVGHGEDDHGYVLDDLSGLLSADDWAERACWAFYKWDADCVVAEVNQGGDLVEKNIRLADENVNVAQVRATRGKYKRAEPVAGLYQQGRMHHVGMFAELEDEQCTFVPGNPDDVPTDRMDGLVWAAHELFLDGDSFFMA